MRASQATAQFNTAIVVLVDQLGAAGWRARRQQRVLEPQEVRQPRASLPLEHAPASAGSVGWFHALARPLRRSLQRARAGALRGDAGGVALPGDRFDQSDTYRRFGCGEGAGVAARARPLEPGKLGRRGVLDRAGLAG